MEVGQTVGMREKHGRDHLYCIRVIVFPCFHTVFRRDPFGFLLSLSLSFYSYSSKVSIHSSFSPQSFLPILPSIQPRPFSLVCLSFHRVLLFMRPTELISSFPLPSPFREENPATLRGSFHSFAFSSRFFNEKKKKRDPEPPFYPFLLYSCFSYFHSSTKVLLFGTWSFIDA